MNKVHLKQLQANISTDDHIYFWKHLNSQHIQLKTRAVKFIERVSEDIPLDNIHTTDWQCAPVAVIIVTNYPHRRVKTYQRFSQRDMHNAIKWFNAQK